MACEWSTSPESSPGRCVLVAARVPDRSERGYSSQQNAGKRNISIDLNVPEARMIALALCDRADIVVENLRPGTLDAFGLDYASLAERNPRIIYISISGYGQQGPYRGRMAYAPRVQPRPDSRTTRCATSAGT